MQLMILENLKKENVEIYLEYLNSCKSSNWETWETTYKTYCNNFKLFLVWFKKAYKNRLLLSKDTLMEMPTIIESYRNYCRNLGNSKRTLMNKTTAISTFYAWCVRRNKIKYHPFSEKLDRLRFTEKDKVRNSYFLTTEQILTVRLYMQVENKKYDLQDRILWELFLDSACRISAIHSLKLSQLDLENGYFKDVKEKEGYVVNAFFFNKCKELLKEWLKEREEKEIESEYLFIAKYKGKYAQMTQGAIRGRIKKLGKILGIEDLYPHTLRKTSINLINNLAGLGLASSYANHSSSGVTSKHYIAKANPTEIRNSIINARKKLGIF